MMQVGYNAETGTVQVRLQVTRLVSQLWALS